MLLVKTLIGAFVDRVSEVDLNSILIACFDPCVCRLSNRVTALLPEDGSRHPSRKCPNAASGRIRSQMILVIASIGTERIAPGAPHIQNQKTSEMMTRTGLSMNRLARSIGVINWPSIR